MPVQFQFTCRDCEACVVVDGHVRDSILDSGCPICNAEATEANFDRCGTGEMTSSQ